MQVLPRDVVRLLMLRHCDPRDAHFLAKSCTSIRRCFSNEELHAFRCGVVRYGMLCRRYYWSQYLERWNERKECPCCAVLMHSQKSYEKHVSGCKRLAESRQTSACQHCRVNMDKNSRHQCPLEPGIECGQSHNDFRPCTFSGVRTEVEYHRRHDCQIECMKCGQWCSMRRARYHGNIVSDRCDGAIYNCPKCKQPWKGIDYGDHHPCLPDLTFHRRDMESSVS